MLSFLGIYWVENFLLLENMPNIEELLEAGSKEIVRGHLRKIVEIYDLEWIVAHELIQNAIDAVQVNPRVERGKVQVTFDFDNDSVTVYDNGTGFKHDLNLLRPGGTGDEKRLSSRSPAKGYQGVGLKAVMYSTNKFSLESRTQDGCWNFQSEGLRSYIDPTQEVLPDYVDDWRAEEGSEETFTQITATYEQGSLVKFINSINRFLNEDSVKWQSLYRQEEKEQGSKPYQSFLEHFLGWYFRTQSYVGCVNNLLNVAVRNPRTGDLEELKPTDIHLTLRSSSKFSNFTDRFTGQIGSWLVGLDRNEFSTTIPYKAWDFAEVIQSNKARREKYRVSPEIVTIKPNDPTWEPLSVSFRDKFLDLKLTPNDQAEDFRERYADIIAILERPRSRASAEDFRDVLEKVTGIYLAIGRTSDFEVLGIPNRGLKLIASNGTPTAHELTVRSTSSTWYLETIHFVINVDATLNMGKRYMVNTTLVGRLRDFFEACYPRLVSISKLFVERDITGGGEGPPMPEVVQNERIFREGIPFRRFPNDENTLVGVFSAAIAKLDPEFSAFGFFANARYDGKFLWEDKEIGSDLELKILEFKLKLEKLVDEFDLATHDKEFSQVSLVVVWDRRVSKPGWNVKGISEARRTKLENQGVPTDLVEYVLENRQGTFVPLICVADLLIKISPAKDKEDNLDEYVRSLG